jgi:hypothetical protein
VLAGLGALLIAAGTVVLSPLATAIGGGEPAAPPAVAGAGTADATAPLPSLSQEQKDEALTIARAEPAVRALLNNPNVSVTVVPWTTIETHELLGAGIDVSWTQPIAVKAHWPVVFYDETERASPPFQATQAQVDATNVTGVHVTVDLSQEKVLGLEPMGSAEVRSFKVDPGFHRTLPPQPQDAH